MAIRAAMSALPPMRSERLRLDAGADLITLFGRAASGEDIPLVAVLNDTLGDDQPENDKLRYFWVFTYCPPSKWQHALASIPFNYHRVRSGSSKVDQDKPPPVIFDFSKGNNSALRRILWSVAQSAVIDSHGWFAQAGSRTYARNERDYRRGHLERGLAVLNAYRFVKDDVPEFEDGRFERLYGDATQTGVSKLLLTDRHFADTFVKNTAASRNRSGKNWELLRQRCEEEGLWFDPVPGAPARARHAVVWISAEKLAASPRERAFNGRFLNIANPWTDSHLRTWEGYTRTFYEAADGTISREPQIDSRSVTMIPLAVYGLDFPRIPALLADFRAGYNARNRELSRKVIDDIGRYALDITPFGEWKYYAGRALFGLFTKRKGIDLDQPSRVSASAQLATMLELRDVLDPDLRRLVERELDRLNVNPLGSAFDAERQIAYLQYNGLQEYARSGKLGKQVLKDRQAEMTRLKHGAVKTGLLRTATIASFGLYRPADADADVRRRYMIERELEQHAVLLEEVAAGPGPVEVAWAPEKFLPSLRFVEAHGARGNEQLALACERIFLRSTDDGVKYLALAALGGMRNQAAGSALARIAADGTVGESYRSRCSALLAGRIQTPPNGHADAAGVAGSGDAP